MGKHDYNVRLKAAQKFLNKGYKVKMTCFFRGREITHANLGLDLLKRMIADLEGLAVVDSGPNMSGNLASIMMSPNKNQKK